MPCWPTCFRGRSRGGGDPSEHYGGPQAGRFLVLEVLAFVVCFMSLHYKFLLTSKDICTAFDYCYVSVYFGVVTVVIKILMAVETPSPSSVFLSFRIIFLYVHIYIYGEKFFFLIFGWDISRYLYYTLSYYNGT